MNDPCTRAGGEGKKKQTHAHTLPGARTHTHEDKQTHTGFSVPLIIVAVVNVKTVPNRIQNNHENREYT